MDRSGGVGKRILREADASWPRILKMSPEDVHLVKPNGAIGLQVNLLPKQAIKTSVIILAPGRNLERPRKQQE
jgi:methyl coenzyme M reductase subunit C